MFDRLLIHPRTRAQLLQFVNKPSHGLILIGQEGSGKKTIAHEIAAAMLNIESTKLESYPYYTLIDPDEQSITIDDIRALQKLLTLRTPQVEGINIRRVLTIIDAGRMRFEAQNAFLKSLEEPPHDTCIIMTADANGDVLETIYSRVQRIDILPVSEEMAKDYFTKQGVPALEIARNYALSQGQVGLLSSLLSKESVHPLKDWVQIAKSLLAKSAGERILQTEVFSKDKPGIILLLDALGRISYAALTQAATSNNKIALERWRNSLQTIADTHEALSHNANTKLMLDHLLLNI